MGFEMFNNVKGLQANRMFLTRDDIHDLTGYSRASTQKKWLLDNGFLFRIGGDGSPRVLTSEVEYQMSHVANPLKKSMDRKHFEPNFEDFLRT